MAKKSRMAANSKIIGSMLEAKVRNLKGLEPKHIVSVSLSQPSLNREQRRVLAKYGASEQVEERV